MGLQQLHGGISPQQDCRLFAKTRWKDPNSRFQWGCYHHQQNHRLHREHCQRLQPAVPLLVLEACRSPSTPAGSHLQCRLQPGWCESVSCEGFFIFFPATLALLCSCCVIRSFGLLTIVWRQMLPILSKHIFIKWFCKLTSVLERKLASASTPPVMRRTWAFVLIHTCMIPPMQSTLSIKLLVCDFQNLSIFQSKM